MEIRHSTEGGRPGRGPIRLIALCAGVAGALFLRVEAHGFEAGAADPGGAIRTTRAVLDAAGGAMRGPSAFQIRSASLGSGLQTGVSRGGVRLSSGFLQSPRAAPVPAPLAGDFNGDERVDFDDFFLFAAAFGQKR
jgi:hypothetical protein